MNIDTTITQIEALQSEIAELKAAIAEAADWHQAERLRQILSARQSELRALRRTRP